MRQVRIVAGVLAAIIIIVWWGIYTYHNRRKAVMLESWNGLQLQVAESAARAAEAWLEVRIRDRAGGKEDAEQEVFQRFIEPVLLLESGAAWFYNRQYVIYDRNSSFPDVYKNKSMPEIFEIQKSRGAHHYEQLCDGVMNGTRGTSWYVWLPEKGREFVAWAPVRLGEETWTVGLSTPEAEIHAHFGIQSRMKREVAGGGIITGLLVAVFFLVLRHQLRNQAVMRLMANTSEKLANSNWELRYQLKERRRAESDRERLLRQLEMEYKQERDAWKEVSFRAAHKVGNAIFGLRGDVDWLNTVFKRNPLNKGEMETAILEARQGLKEANSIIREFKKYYRPDEFSPARLSVNDVLEDAVGHVEKAAAGIVFERKYAGDLPLVDLDRTKFRQCISELLENACHFMDPNGRITIGSALSAEDDRRGMGLAGHAVSIYVKDNGPGVVEENKSVLFHPFFSTRAKGSGMGLAIVQQYVELHGGRIQEIGEPGKGAEFLILLPIHREL